MNDAKVPHQRQYQSIMRNGQSVSEAARVATQRKIYCVWFLAIVLPFAVLFSLFPSTPRLRRATPETHWNSIEDHRTVSAYNAPSETVDTQEKSVEDLVSPMEDEKNVDSTKFRKQDTVRSSSDKPEELANLNSTDHGTDLEPEKDGGSSDPSGSSPEEKLPSVDPILPATSEDTESNVLIKEPEVEEISKSGETHDQLLLSEENQNESTVVKKMPKTPKNSPVQCDLSKGRWIPDTKGPLYSNATCPWIPADQNCMKNGRPDTDYLHWRWKPDACELNRFDAKTFLNLMKQKSFAFVGDSVARNQMQSLLCLLAQVESPKEILHDKKKQSLSWHFTSFNFTLSAFWAPYLVQDTEEYLEGAPDGIKKLHLDVLEKDWTTMLPGLDVVVLSTGQWFQKSAAYIVRKRLIGCHSCSDSNSIKEIGFYNAFRAAIRSAVVGVTTLPGYRGITFLQTFMADHSKNRACLHKAPVIDNSTRVEGLNKKMYEIQSEEFKKAMKRGIPNESQLKLLDTTYPALLRPDGHPGPYNNIGSFSRNETEPVKQDCFNWCLPGPVDTWNEILLQMLSDSLRTKALEPVD